MTEIYDDNTYDENVDDDLTSYSVDDETQLQPEDTLDGPLDADSLDAGYVANDRPMGVDRFGTTAAEQAEGETIDMRIKQEIPDPATAYGAPDNESGLDRDDEIDPEDDYTGDGERRAGRLVAPDEGVRADDEAGAIGTDVGIDGGAASAEEAAMHVVDEDELDEDGNGVDDLADELAAEQRELASEAEQLGITDKDVEDFEGEDGPALDD